MPKVVTGQSLLSWHDFHKNKGGGGAGGGYLNLPAQPRQNRMQHDRVLSVEIRKCGHRQTEVCCCVWFGVGCRVHEEKAKLSDIDHHPALWVSARCSLSLVMSAHVLVSEPRADMRVMCLHHSVGHVLV
eukprot:1994107-Rhodomonas_salina.1